MDTQTFGIADLVLVDAARNRDVPGAIDCTPVNKCFGDAAKFNVRAETFGDVRKVKFDLDGPMKETHEEGEHRVFLCCCAS